MIFKKINFNRQGGFSVVEVILAAGLMTLISGSLATMMLNQNKSITQMSQKIATNDMKNGLITSMQDINACAVNLSSLVNPGLTFDTTVVNKTLNVSKIRVSQDPTSASLIEVGREITPGSGLRVSSIKLDNLTDVGLGKWTGIWTVSFSNATTGLFFKSVTLNPQTFDVDATDPAAAKITGCHAVAGSGGGIVWIDGPIVAGSPTINYLGYVGMGTPIPNGPLSVTPVQYKTGTASQFGTTVTGSGTSWTSAMVGSQFVFGNGVSAGTITAFGNATTLTVSNSQAVASQIYSINYSGLQVASSGNVGIGTAGPTSKLDVRGSITGGLITATGGLDASRIISSGSNSSVYSNIELDTDTNYGNIYGSEMSIDSWGVYSPNTITKMVGYSSDVSNSRSSTTTDGMGSEFIYYATQGITTNAYGSKSMVTASVSNAGRVTNAYGIHARVNNQNSGIGYFTNSYGAHLSVTGNSVANTNAYGLYLGSVVGTNKWSLYSSDALAPAYIAGKIGIDVSAPEAKFHLFSGVSGTPVTTGALQPFVSMRLQGASSTSLDIGEYSVFPGTWWLQAVDKINLSLNKNIVLNPNGGNVGVGISSPQTTLQVAGVISPATNNTYTLGNATYRFTEVYATNGVINTSDRREKKDIYDTDLGLDFINKLRPVSYRWRTGVDNDVHYGLIAQEAEQVIADVGKTEKTSIVTHDEATDRYGVRYSELISPLIKAVQDLYNRLIEIETHQSTQDREIDSLKADSAAKDYEIEKLKQENAAKAKEMEDLKAYLCSKDKKIPNCK